jgi:hypothetical protein
LFNGSSNFHTVSGQPLEKALAMFFGRDDHSRIPCMQSMTHISAQFLDQKLVCRIELDPMLVTVVLKPAALRNQCLILYGCNGLHFAPVLNVEENSRVNRCRIKGAPGARAESIQRLL